MSWRSRAEAVAGFALARFIMLGVTFLVVPFIYWALSMSQIPCFLCIWTCFTLIIT